MQKLLSVKMWLETAIFFCTAILHFGFSKNRTKTLFYTTFKFMMKYSFSLTYSSKQKYIVNGYFKNSTVCLDM